jgi:GST-like protein
VDYGDEMVKAHYTLYGAPGTGAVAVEAALTLAVQAYDLVEAAPLDSEADSDAVARINPMRQVPALILPSGEVMTESAAILIWLADSHPKARLAPTPQAAERAQFLRWMAYVSAQIYALYWIRDDPSRLAADKAHEAVIEARTRQRITSCWAAMEAQVSPGAWILGDQLSMLDVYVAVVSRWGPGRRRFYEAAPRMGEAVGRLDSDPRLATLWAERFPFTDGWER